MHVKKIVTYILLLTFVFQISRTIAIGGVIQKIFYELSSLYSDENGLSFIDFVFNDGMTKSQQNEENTQKNLGQDLYSKSENSSTFGLSFEKEHKLYLIISTFFASGFYLSLIQPPD